MLIRGSVEDSLNAMLDEVAANLCNAERHERSESRKDYRSGHYHRKLLTGAGELDIAIPKLRLAPFKNSRIHYRFCKNIFSLVKWYALEGLVVYSDGLCFACVL